MQPTERDIATAAYRREDLVKQAEKELLIRIAQENASDQTPIHQRMLVRFGSWLEQLGCRLKSHYMEVADLEVQRTALS
ncbi:MAG: hypothetical protein GQ524_02405 [Anaerolineales bacterium]|nr:hypothetical protein [Anaerolineales bacterium]